MPDTRLARLWARLTPAERRALAVLSTAWLVGAAAGSIELDTRLARYAGERLHPPLPTPAELAARLPPGDPRPGWLAAGLALRDERARAGSAPAPIDPRGATRADWDRLPGIGPRLAEAILAHGEAHGGITSPEDLLAVRGIGPRTLERLGPYLRWPEPGRGGSQAVRPSLNGVDEAWLAELPGIGPKIAMSLVRERQRRGGFVDWAEILEIEGIGATRLLVLQKATRLPGVRSAAGAADTSRERT